MRYLTACLTFCTLSLATLTSPTLADVVVSDDFSNNGALLGTTADIGGVWTITGTSTTNPLTVVANALPLANTGQDAFVPFSAAFPKIDGNAINTTMTINVSAAGTGDYFYHYTPTNVSSTAFFNRLFVRAGTAPNTFNVGVVGTSGTGSTPLYGTTDFLFNTNYELSSTWNFIGGGTNNDTINVLMNGLSEVAYTWSSATVEPTQLQSAAFRQGGGTVAPTLIVDNLVVNTVPEPTSALLLIGSALGLGVCRRRRG